MEGLSTVELAVLLRRNAATSAPSSSSSQRGSVQDALFVQVVVPRQLTEEEHQQVDVLARYAQKKQQNGNGEAAAASVSTTGRTRGETAKQSKGKGKGKGRQTTEVDLRTRVERRFLSSKLLLPVIEESTGCRYLYTGDAVSEDGTQIGLYYRCAHPASDADGNEDDNDDCSGTLRILLPLDHDRGDAAPAPLAAASPARARVTRTYGSPRKSNRSTTAAASTSRVGSGSAESGSQVASMIKLCHPTTHKHTYAELQALAKEKEQKRARYLQEARTLLVDLQKRLAEAEEASPLSTVEELWSTLKSAKAGLLQGASKRKRADTAQEEEGSEANGEDGEEAEEQRELNQNTSNGTQPRAKKRLRVTKPTSSATSEASGVRRRMDTAVAASSETEDASSDEELDMNLDERPAVQGATAASVRKPNNRETSVAGSASLSAQSRQQAVPIAATSFFSSQPVAPSSQAATAPSAAQQARASTSADSADETSASQPAKRKKGRPRGSTSNKSLLTELAGIYKNHYWRPASLDTESEARRTRQQAAEEAEAQLVYTPPVDDSLQGDSQSERGRSAAPTATTASGARVRKQGRHTRRQSQPTGSYVEDSDTSSESEDEEEEQANAADETVPSLQPSVIAVAKKRGRPPKTPISAPPASDSDDGEALQQQTSHHGKVNGVEPKNGRPGAMARKNSRPAGTQPTQTQMQEDSSHGDGSDEDVGATTMASARSRRASLPDTSMRRTPSGSSNQARRDEQKKAGKTPRLSINGKRLGRPPGSKKKKAGFKKLAPE